MPRRNEELNPGSVYWVKNLETNKGYTVYSKERLDVLIESGSITDNHIIQKSKSAEF